MSKNSNDKEYFVGYEIKSLDHMIKRHVKSVIKENGFPEMTVMHSWIITYLAENKSRDVYQKDIEKEFNIGRSSVTGMIKLMEQKGYISREMVEGDARLKKLTLTQKGLSHVNVMESDRKHVEQVITRGLSDKDMEDFKRVVDKMKENLSETEFFEKEGDIDV